MRVSGFSILVCALLLGLAALPVQAHDQSTSYITITVAPDRLTTTVAFRPIDLEEGFGLARDREGQIQPEAFQGVAQRVFPYLQERLHLSADFEELALEPQEARLEQDERGGPMCVFRFTTPLARHPSELSVLTELGEPMNPEHLSLVKVVAGEQVQQAVLSPADPHRRFSSGGTWSLGRQVGQFIHLGIEHIFLGYDHILFLLALVSVGGRLRDLVKIVTAFTVAHSITLVLAALAVVSLPPRLIEAGIALSIVYVAVENFWIRRIDHRWILTFFFGLVHGFGFANVLREMGLPAQGLVSSLLAFNLGVEVGQICIVILLFPLILWLSRQAFHKATVGTLSGLILLAGLGWFIERLFILSFMPF